MAAVDAQRRLGHDDAAHLASALGEPGRVALAHHLAQHQVAGDVGGIEHAVQRRVEQVVADDDQPVMLLRLRHVVRHHVPHWDAARNGVHRGHPAMHLRLDQMREGIAQRGRQRFQRRLDQRLVVEIGIGQRVDAGDQPVEHAVAADIVPGALDIDAAAAEALRHEPGALDLALPERLVEQRGDAQVMRRPVEMGEMAAHALAQPAFAEIDGTEPVVRRHISTKSNSRVSGPFPFIMSSR